MVHKKFQMFLSTKSVFFTRKTGQEWDSPRMCIAALLLLPSLLCGERVKKLRVLLAWQTKFNKEGFYAGHVQKAIKVEIIRNSLGFSVILPVRVQCLSFANPETGNSSTIPHSIVMLRHFVLRQTSELDFSKQLLTPSCHLSTR